MKIPLSTIVRDQLPEHIRDNYELFISFMEAYYEWAETENQNDGINEGLVAVKDVDRTVDMFINYLITELSTIDNIEIATDKRLFIKHVHDMFRAKGTEKSFKLFFRLIYGIDSEVEYPSESILRASDGQYFKRKVVTLELISGDVANALNTFIVGETSGTSAAVETIESYWLPYGMGQFLHKVTINNSSLTGDFTPNEIVIANKDTDKEVSFYIKRVLSNIKIIDQGVRYSVGQKIEITSTTGQGAKAIVSKVSSAELIKLNATYSKSNTTVTVDLGDVYHLFVPSDYCFLEFNSGIETGVFLITNVLDSFKFQFEYGDSETIVSDNVNVYNADKYGRILEIEMLDNGINYEDATFAINDIE